jgi:hypothetical protein
METYDVAATIVTYRSNPDDVAAAVESFRQAALNGYIQIVDNASPGNYAASLAKTVDAPVLNSGANRGFGFGHNFGLRHAPPSRYYLVLNPDVVIHRGTLESLVEFLDANREVGLVSPRVLGPDGAQQWLNKRDPTVFDLAVRRFLPGAFRHIGWIRHRMNRYVMRDRGYHDVVAVPYVTGCFMLFRTEMLRLAGPFDERFFLYLEDADITRRLRAFARAVYYPHAAITHKWSRGSHRSLKLTWVTMQSAVRYFNKWGWKVV